MKFYLLGLVMALSGAAIHAAPSKAVAKKSDEPTYCEKTVMAHGMLSRAQFECGYSQYDGELITDSAKCFKYELKGEHADEVLKFGMSIFDRKEQELGKQGACKFFLKQFPDYVRK